MFEEFGRLLIEGMAYNVTEVERFRKYITAHNNAAKREKWSRVEYEVTINETNQYSLASVASLSTLGCCAAMS